MAAWLRYSVVLTYADDTSTSVTGKTIEEVIKSAKTLSTVKKEIKKCCATLPF